MSAPLLRALVGQALLPASAGEETTNKADEVEGNRTTGSLPRGPQALAATWTGDRSSPMKLVFYSDQVIPENEAIDRRAMRLIGKASPTIGYMPSCTESSRRHFEEKVRYYGRYGVERIVYFDVDREYDPSRLGELMACDAIHLSGGDVRHFLGCLRATSMLDRLRGYVRDGGVLIGVSAGAILMTPDIRLNVRFHGWNAEPYGGTSALGLVDFEFFPHLNRERSYLSALKDYSAARMNAVYAACDGGGIVVEGDGMEFFGEALLIRDGEVFSAGCEDRSQASLGKLGEDKP